VPYFLLERHKVRDYDKWKAVFDEDADNRAASGSRGAQIFATPTTPRSWWCSSSGRASRWLVSASDRRIWARNSRRLGSPKGWEGPSLLPRGGGEGTGLTPA
jgi:hypothetical protein